jgi:hypothetical protein
MAMAVHYMVTDGIWIAYILSIHLPAEMADSMALGFSFFLNLIYILHEVSTKPWSLLGEIIHGDEGAVIN